MVALVVVVADVHRAAVAAVVQHQANPTALRAAIHAAIHVALGATTAVTRVERGAAPIPTSCLGAMQISHPATMPTSSRVTMYSPPTTHRVTSAHAHRKSATALVAAVTGVGVAVVAAWVDNAAKARGPPPKVGNPTRCAPALT